MSRNKRTRTSKFLSYVLRHHPESIGLKVDSNGWAHLPTLIEKAKRHGNKVSRQLIEEIMEKSSKKRFSISKDGQYIRAGYGHSIDVDLELEPQLPPDTLYHGTACRNVDSIKKNGLQPQSRNHVHLSQTKENALSAGGRHGTPIVLTVRAGVMFDDGYPVYRSESEPHIWLTAKVPPRYIVF